MEEYTVTWVLITLVCGLWGADAVLGNTVCRPAQDCGDCLLPGRDCRWCDHINACALVADPMEDMKNWTANNCSYTAINTSSLCPRRDLPTTTPTTTPKKLKCSAARAVLPEEECDESVLDEEADRRGSIMVILPLISALLGVGTFFVMVFIWIRCFYNRKVHERGSSEGITEMTDLHTAEEPNAERRQNGS
ncbi:uncharacterized protein LOC135475128 [Liolophura sinensis]|uniref:uncharacterized protein LOC135475128 n=1 Tax=Liolophura sinensis TaxID=3198878 RepID=UPI0031591814